MLCLLSRGSFYTLCCDFVCPSSVVKTKVDPGLNFGPILLKDDLRAFFTLSVCLFFTTTYAKTYKLITGNKNSTKRSLMSHTCFPNSCCVETVETIFYFEGVLKRMMAQMTVLTLGIMFDR